MFNTSPYPTPDRPAFLEGPHLRYAVLGHKLCHLDRAPRAGGRARHHPV